MLFDDIAWARLVSATAAIHAAIEATQKLKGEQTDSETAEPIGMLQQLLQQAVDDLQAVTSRQTTHEATIFPNAGMMLAAIDRLPPIAMWASSFAAMGRGVIFSPFGAETARNALPAS
jgi:hypothetical protein